MAGFRFVGGTMRRLRFELSPDAQADEGTGSAWGHIVLWTDRRTGYDVLRDFLRSLQQCGRIRPGLALGLLQDLPYLTRVGFWRYVHNQLFWPSPARYELHVIAEQLPRRDNQITLSAEKDVFGLPLAAINWRVGQPDCRPFQAYMRRFDSFWKRHGLERIGDLRWLVNPDVSMISDLSRGSDISHPGGSTRMGTAEKSAVVDQNLRTFAVSNLWVSSTSVFPSGASSNPTLMLMLFTMRLGDHLVAIMEA
jgi:hypothetical protein